MQMRIFSKIQVIMNMKKMRFAGGILKIFKTLVNFSLKVIKTIMKCLKK